MWPTWLISCLKKMPPTPEVVATPPPPYEIAVSEHRFAIYEVWNNHTSSPGDAIRLHYNYNRGADLTETQIAEIDHVLTKCSTLVRHVCCARGGSLARADVICNFLQSNWLHVSATRLLTRCLTCTVSYTVHGVQVHFFQVPPCMLYPATPPPPHYIDRR